MAGGMDSGWFSPVAEELAQCLIDARACAAACEALLERARAELDAGQQRTLVSALVAAAAVSRVIIELLDRPQHLVLAAAQVCRETTAEAAQALERLDLPVDTSATVAALRAASASASALLDAAARQD